MDAMHGWSRACTLAHRDGSEGDCVKMAPGTPAERLREATEKALRADAALLASEAKYRKLIDSLDEGFCVIEVLFEGDKAVDYRFVEANPAFIGQTGLTDAVGRTMRELAPEHEAHWFDIYGRVALTGEPVRFEAPAEALHRWYDVYAFRLGGPDERRVAVLFNDISERKRSETALKTSEARQAYLLNLSDVLRPLGDPASIQGEAARILGERLGVDRALYTEQDGDTVVVHRDWVRGVPSMAGRYPSEAWGSEFVTTYRRGKPYVVEDVSADPRLSDVDRTAFRNAGIGAFVGVGLVKEGRLVATFGAHTPGPRAWTDEEIELVRETAERTWEAVERARAEAAWRATEERLSIALEQRVLERTAERDALRRRLAEAEDDERRRLSRELHDEAGQRLTALALGLQALSDIALPGSEVDRRAADLLALTRTLGQELHAVAVRLRPRALDDFGLETAISSFVEEWSRQTGIPVDVHTRVAKEGLAKAVESAIYRIVQEALTNVARHSEATLASVVVERRDGHIVAIVEDNGHGFNTAEDGREGPFGLGLLGIGERAMLLGGSLDVESTPGSGTTVFVRIPLGPRYGDTVAGA